MKDLRNIETGIEKSIQNSFKENDELIIPDDFAFKMSRLLENSLIKKRVLKEWSYKLALIMGLLGTFIAIFWFTSNANNQTFLQLLIEHQLLILSVMLIGIFIFFFDQVILKFMFIAKSKKR